MMARFLLLCIILVIDVAFCQLTAQDQQNLINFHNQVRAQVCVGPISWDSKAASVAQTYANGCVYAHNANRNADYTALGGAQTGLGENIAEGTFGYYTVLDLANLWYGEKTSYPCGTVISDTNYVTFGHYTQMVWANSNGVGCGAADCNGQLFLVCDYSPPGNFIGETPFPAANCQTCNTSPATSQVPAQTTQIPIVTTQLHSTSQNNPVVTTQLHFTSQNNPIVTTQIPVVSTNPYVTPSTAPLQGIVIKLVIPANITNFNITVFQNALANFLKVAGNFVVIQSVVQTQTTITITILIMDSPNGSAAAIVLKFLQQIQNNDPTVTQALGTPILSASEVATATGNFLSFSCLFVLVLILLQFIY